METVGTNWVLTSEKTGGLKNNIKNRITGLILKIMVLIENFMLPSLETFKLFRVQ